MVQDLAVVCGVGADEEAFGDGGGAGLSWGVGSSRRLGFELGLSFYGCLRSRQRYRCGYGVVSVAVAFALVGGIVRAVLRVYDASRSGVGTASADAIF